MGKIRKIGAVILNYKGWRHTLECLDSVLNSSLRPDWLVIVDNASGDNSLKCIHDWLKKRETVAGPLKMLKPAHLDEEQGQWKTVLLALDKNCGYAAGNNAGIKLLLASGADAVWILNNDVRVAPDALYQLREAANHKKKPGLCGGVVCRHDQPELVQCLAGGWTSRLTGLSRLAGAGLRLGEARLIPAEDIEKEINFIYGACVFVSRAFIQRVGLMDENYFLYCEEQDWAFRARGEFDLVYASQALVWHKEGASTGFSRKNFSASRALRLLKSRLRLAWKFNPWALPIICLGQIFALCRNIARRLKQKN